MNIQYCKPKNLKQYFLKFCEGVIQYFPDETWHSYYLRYIESTPKLNIYIFVSRDLHTSQTLQQGLDENKLMQHLTECYPSIGKNTANIKIMTFKEAYYSDYIQSVYPYRYKNHYMLLSPYKSIIMKSNLDLSNDVTLNYSLLIVEVTKK